MGPSRGPAGTEPGIGPQPVTPTIPGFLAPTEPYRPELLAETRGALAPGGPGESASGIRPLIEAILSKMDVLAERPIDLTVTTQLDGRKVAQSVYKDLRERKIKNYETL